MTFLRISRSCGLRQIGDVLIGDEHPPLIGFHEAHDVAQADRLSHAAPADDGQGLARIHVKAHID